MIAVICHDAGGAEILSSYISREGLSCLCVLDGPARRIFERKLGAVPTASLQDALAKTDWILCGTSWQSDLEFNAIQSARCIGKRSVAFLDHWLNYRPRFSRNGKVHLPDELWVGDDIAEQLARAAFPELQIRRLENPYFKDIREQFAQLPSRVRRRSQGVQVLYAGEIIDEYSKWLNDESEPYGYTEHEALAFFLDHLYDLGESIERITIRPHPAESFDKYQWAHEKYGELIVAGGKRPLLDEISQCDVVVGCESMAMVIGLLAKKRVISCIPPGGKACSLPQLEIEYLRVMVRQ